MKKDKSECVKAKVNQYGIKTLPDGQKYLLCHFVSLDDGSGKTMREKLNYIMGGCIEGKNIYGDIIKEKLSISAMVQDDNGKYLFDPFKKRATGFVIEDYEKPNLGWEASNKSTDVKTTGYQHRLKRGSEYAFIQALKNEINEKKEGTKKETISRDDFFKFINYFNGQPYSTVTQALYCRGNITLGEGERSFTIKSDKKKDYIGEIDKIANINKERFLKKSKNNAKIANANSGFLQTAKVNAKKDYDIFLDRWKKNKEMKLDNNQMNILSAKLSSMIINVCEDYEDEYYMISYRRADKLKEIVLQINDIIDIQLNTFGHKNILVRDAKTKKVQVMPLCKFVDFVEKECKKIGIEPLEINKNFPTFLSVFHKMEALKVKKEANKTNKYTKKEEQKPTYKKDHMKISNKETTTKSNDNYISK